MATVNHENLRPEGFSGDDILLIRWVLTTANLDGQWIAVPSHRDISWHFFGTFGGATVIAQGSNEIVASPTSAVQLKDNANAVISATVDGIQQSVQATHRIRPFLSVAGAGATITIIAKCARNR